MGANDARARILRTLYQEGARPATSLRRPDDGNALGQLMHDGLVAQRPSRQGLGVVYELTRAGVAQAKRIGAVR